MINVFAQRGLIIAHEGGNQQRAFIPGRNGSISDQELSYRQITRARQHQGDKRETQEARGGGTM